MPAPGLAVVADPQLRAYDFGPGHPWNPTSRWMAVRLLESWEPQLPPGALHWIRAVALATPRELEQFHARAHVDRVRRASEQAAEVLLDGGDTPAFPGCFDAAARVVGATLRAVSTVETGTVRRAFQPFGGLHHAAPGRASGFCIFNDVAVAIASYLARAPAHRVAYIDLDVHHGDGVMYGFYDSGRVLDIDFHESGEYLFPGTGAVRETGRGDGAGLKVNVPLPPGAGDETFLPLFHRIAPPMLREFRPDLVIVQHGLDAHAGDGLGHLQYSDRAYAEALGILLPIVEEVAGGRILVTGGGGYEAQNVAIGLAAAGSRLAGSSGGLGEGEPTPAAWRSEFTTELGSPAPAHAAGRPAFSRGRNAAVQVDRVLSDLSRALGRTFPPTA